jgi:hypothetical protein
MNVSLEPRDCPYVGLDPFKSEYAPFFFGRERDSRVIADSVAARRITILFGASGVGKSSVLNVGLPAELRARQPDWIIATHRDWHDRNGIEGRVMGALWDALPGDTALEATKSPLLLILDQFEEYFLYETRTEVTAAEIAFGELLSRRDVDLHVLIAVRDDSLHLLNKLRAVVPFVLETTIQLRHLNDDGARSAIRGPIKRYNDEFRKGTEIEIEDRLVDAVIAQLREGASRTAGQGVASGSPEIELPYLQLTMTKLWDKAGGRNATALRLQTLDDLGGVREIARKHVDQILGGLTPKEQALCADIFRYLVTGSGSKIAYPTDALAKQVTSDRRQGSSNGVSAIVSTEEVAAVLEELTQGEKRLLRPVKARAVYELFHDVLGLPILEWRQKFLDNAAREEAERERQAKEDAECKAKEAIDLATKEANARARVEAQLRDEAEHRVHAETQARVAAEEAAREAKAGAAAQTEKAAAERQAREAAENLASEKIVSARRLRRALIGVAGAALVALLGSGVSFYSFRQAAEQSQRARRLAKDVQTQLDRANGAIAASIDSELVFKPGQPFAPRTRNALWKLARANDAVRTDYVAILANRPRELARAAPGFPQISRSLGALWPPSDQAERLMATAINALTTESIETSDSTTGMIRILAPKLTDAQTGQVLDSALKQFAQTGNAFALRGLARAIQALPVPLTDVQADLTLDSILKQASDPRALSTLAQAIQALAPKLGDAQASQALDTILKLLTHTTDPFTVQALTRMIQALAPQFTDAQARQALDTILKLLTHTTDPRALSTIAQAIRALASKLTDAQASQALDFLLKQFAQASDPRALPTLAQAIQALAPKLGDAQASQALDTILKLFTHTTDPFTVQALTRVIQALAPKFTDAQARQVLDAALKQFAQPSGPAALQGLAGAIKAMAPRLTEAQASQAIDSVLEQLALTPDPFDVFFLADAIHALAPKLADAQASQAQTSQALDSVLKLFAGTTGRLALQASAEAIKALAPLLTEAQAGQALDAVLKQLPQMTDPSAVQSLASVIKAVTPKLTDAQAQAALDLLLKEVGQTKLYEAQPQAKRDPATNWAQAIQALASKLSEGRVQAALDPILEHIGAITTPDVVLQALGQALQSLAPKLTNAQADQALVPLLMQFGVAADADALTALAQALAALAPKLTNPQADQALDPILQSIAGAIDSDTLQALAQALAALAPKLDATKAQEVSDRAGASLAWAASDDEAADWARALVALLDRADDPQRTQKLVAPVAYPAAAGTATDVLLDAIRTLVAAAPAKEAGTNAALQWLAAKYPEVLRPPVCPKPPQEFDDSGLQCPSDDILDSVGVTPMERRTETRP